MRCVDPQLAGGVTACAHERAGLGAVAVQHIRVQLAQQRGQPRVGQHIERMRFAMDREAVDAERKARGDFGKGGLGARSARQAVREDADLMAAIDLAVGEVEDVTDDSANRSTHCVQDAQRLRRHLAGLGGHDLMNTSRCAISGAGPGGNIAAS